MSGVYFAADLGTCNIKFYCSEADRYIMEKDMIAVLNRNLLYAYGDSAYEMYEKAPANISISAPVSRGVISDYNHLQTIIEEIVAKNEMSRTKRRAEFFVAVPSDITEVEKRAFHEIFFKSRMKPKNVLMIDKPLADVAGAGLDAKDPTGVMVVDIGADTTEISVVSLGGLVQSRLLYIGGNTFDADLINYVRKNYNLRIGEKTACAIKEGLSSAIPGKSGSLPAVGIDIVTGLPIEMYIDADVVYASMTEHISEICVNIKEVLEKTPPELSKDVMRGGIYLTGGSSRISGLDMVIRDTCGVRVNLLEDPEISALRGMARMAGKEKYTDLFFSERPRIFR